MARGPLGTYEDLARGYDSIGDIIGTPPRLYRPPYGVLTPAAIAKVKEIMATQDPVPAGLRIGVAGGGCSGFQYSMSFENQSGMMDKVYKFEDLKVFVDATSAMYLQNCTVDYVETLEAAGFKVLEAAGGAPAGEPLLSFGEWRALKAICK